MNSAKEYLITPACLHVNAYLITPLLDKTRLSTPIDSLSSISYSWTVFAPRAALSHSFQLPFIDFHQSLDMISCIFFSNKACKGLNTRMQPCATLGADTLIYSQYVSSSLSARSCTIHGSLKAYSWKMSSPNFVQSIKGSPHALQCNSCMHHFRRAIYLNGCLYAFRDCLAQVGSRANS